MGTALQGLATAMMSLLKLIGPPGSIGFVLCGVAAGLFVRHRWPKARTLANIWLAAFTALHVLLALPVIAYPIADALQPYRPPATLPQANPLVIFDGDNRRGRLAIAMDIYRRWPMLRAIVLGEDWLVDQLVERGFPRASVERESGPGTTFEQMEWLRDLVDARPQAAPVVIASRLQTPRVAALASAMGIEVTLLASPVDIEPRHDGVRAFIPTYAALRMSRDAIYEHAALAYYSRRGWIDRPLPLQGR